MRILGAPSPICGAVRPTTGDSSALSVRLSSNCYTLFPLDPHKPEDRQRILLVPDIQIQMTMCHDPVIRLQRRNHRVNGFVQRTMRGCQRRGRALVMGKMRRETPGSAGEYLLPGNIPLPAAMDLEAGYFLPVCTRCSAALPSCCYASRNRFVQHYLRSGEGAARQPALLQRMGTGSRHAHADE